MSMETDHNCALEILRIKAELAAARAASAEYIARTDPVLDGKEKLEDDLAAAQEDTRRMDSAERLCDCGKGHESQEGLPDCWVFSLVSDGWKIGSPKPTLRDALAAKEDKP